MIKSIQVLGFCFNQNYSEVVLIKKTKPKWQAGQLNAIGGKLENRETPSQAIVREFFEETGVETNILDWNYFALVNNADNDNLSAVFCYEMANENFYSAAKTCEEEEIQKWNVQRILIRPHLIVPNLSVLLLLASCREFERPINLVRSVEAIQRQKDQLR